MVFGRYTWEHVKLGFDLWKKTQVKTTTIVSDTWWLAKRLDSCITPYGLPYPIIYTLYIYTSCDPGVNWFYHRLHWLPHSSKDGTFGKRKACSRFCVFGPFTSFFTTTRNSANFDLVKTHFQDFIKDFGFPTKLG